MKKFAFLLTLVSTLFFASCDQCEDMDCNNGDCDAGECFCDIGYYGDACEKGYIDVLLDKGTWDINMFETDPDGEYLGVFYSSIIADPVDKLKFSIPSFYQYEGNNLPIDGFIGDNWAVTFPAKTTDGITVSGSGQIYGVPVGHMMELTITVEEPFLTRTFGIRMYHN